MESQPPPSTEVKGKVGRRHRPSPSPRTKKLVIAICGVYVNGLFDGQGILAVFPESESVRSGGVLIRSFQVPKSSSEILLVDKPE